MKKLVLIGVMVITLLFSQSLAFAGSTQEGSKGTVQYTSMAARVLTSAPVVPVTSLKPLIGLNVNTLRNGLRGDYYNGMNFEKYDTFSIDNDINFNWGTTKVPALGLKHDNFSVRWTGFLFPRYNEAYTFTTRSDDGVRLYINGQPLINDWNSHGEKDNQATVILTANQPYSITLEYFQNTSSASVKLYWASISQRKEIIPSKRLFTQVLPAPAKGAGVGLLESTYDGANFEAFKSSRLSDTINYEKDSKVKLHTPFSIRWMGKIQPLYSELYTFRTVSDDGVRVWINGQKIIDRWSEGSSVESTGTIQLQAGQLYDIKVEYFENNTWPAACKLYWASQNQQLQIVPKSQLYPVQVAPVGTGNGLRADFYNDKELKNLVSETLTSTVNFDWGDNTIPVQGLGHNYFSVRWTGKIQPIYSELYNFKTISDDGVRLWINGKKIIDDWTTHSAREDNGTIQLAAGQSYDIKLEYYQETNAARVQLYWSSASQGLQIVPQSQLYAQPVVQLGNGNGLKAEYYADKQLSVLRTTRVDTDINFDWGNRGLPIDGVAHDNFSIRWTGRIQPLHSETYTFKTVSDDGIRLWINGVLLINDWNTHTAKTNTASIQLTGGQMYDIKIEYYQETGLAKAELYWSSKTQKQEIVPQRQLYSN